MKATQAGNGEVPAATRTGKARSGVDVLKGNGFRHGSSTGRNASSSGLTGIGSAIGSMVSGRKRPAQSLAPSLGMRMSYVDSNLVSGESVVYETRLHWVVMFGQLLLGLLVLVVPGIVLISYALESTGIDPGNVHLMQGGGAVLIILGVVIIFLGMMRRNATEMAVTNRRVVIKTGLASRRTIEMLLNKVESIEVSETAFGRMLGFGTIVVIGTGGTLEPFHKMAHPLEFRNHVQQQIEHLR
jgi:Bacterial PH domain